MKPVVHFDGPAIQSSVDEIKKFSRSTVWADVVSLIEESIKVIDEQNRSVGSLQELARNQGAGEAYASVLGVLDRMIAYKEVESAVSIVEDQLGLDAEERMREAELSLNENM